MIEIGRLRAEDESDIRAFNERLAAGGELFQFPTRLEDLATPTKPDAALWTEAWVAREEGQIRGGFLLKHEQLHTLDGTRAIGNFQLPLSEGILDRRYAMVGLSIAQHAIKQMDTLYCLGMGSLSRPLPRLLQRFGWRVEEVPFYFLVTNGARFARHIQALRVSKRNRALLHAARWTGLASLGTATWHAATSVRRTFVRNQPGAILNPVTFFDQRVDSIQSGCRGEYAALLDRGQEALRIKFPVHDARLHRFIVSTEGRDVGWLVVTATDLKNHKQFGDLRLGAVVDGLVPKKLLANAIGAAVRQLRRLEVDLIVSNQTSEAWGAALRLNMFAQGPSNFILGRSPTFLPGTSLSAIHMNRGDGDGPINL